MYKQRKIKFLAFCIFVFFQNFISAQDINVNPVIKAKQVISERGEIIISFVKPSFISLAELSAFLSIDEFQNDTVVAYANNSGFRKFLELKIDFTVLDPPYAKMVPHVLQREFGTEWEVSYPTYDEYLQLMQSFADNNPEICKLYEFGLTPNSHKLLAVKISDNVNIKETEPVVFYTSTMHGDEPLGYSLMLKLISHLLVNYSSDNKLKSIIDSTEIWINPLANPDGTYFVSDNSINGSTRFNSNNTDLNRDFPDVRYDYYEKNNSQPENIAMMNFMEEIQPVLAANFHGGAEVVNYPWDSWEFTHADDSWYRRIARSYADTVHRYAPATYMTYLDNGITNGYNWYQVFGGRQDYLNYFNNGREVTIELSNEKIPDESTLNNFWNYNRNSLIQYIEQALTGISGQVTDSLMGIPVMAKISISNYDRHNSFIFSKKEDGTFFRLLMEGNYPLLISAAGYHNKNINAFVSNGNMTKLDIKLSPDNNIYIYPNPFDNIINIVITDPGSDMEVTIFNVSGQKIDHISQKVIIPGNQVIRIKNIASGFYIIQVKYKSKIINYPAIKLYNN